MSPQAKHLANMPYHKICVCTEYWLTRCLTDDASLKKIRTMNLKTRNLSEGHASMVPRMMKIS